MRGGRDSTIDWVDWRRASVLTGQGMAKTSVFHGFYRPKYAQSKWPERTALCGLAVFDTYRSRPLHWAVEKGACEVCFDYGQMRLGEFEETVFALRSVMQS